MKSTDLIRFRKKLNISQRRCAQMLGCSYRAIQAWETDGRRIPDYIAYAISAILFDLPPYAK